MLESDGSTVRCYVVTRSKNDLSKQLVELKNELLTLRVQKIAGGNAAKLTRMYVQLSTYLFV